MNRIVAAAVVVFCIGVSAAITSLGSPVDAQDATGDRLAALETQVADQAGDISSLRKRVRALEDVAKEESDDQKGQDDSGNGTTPADGAVTLSGTGVTVTDKFTLAAGRYKVSATVETTGFDGFSVLIYGPGPDDQDYVFNEIIEDAGTWTGSAVFDAGQGGEFFAETSNTSSNWTLTFEQL